ncbi:MAG: alcohol dehydrogenase catalytic domain-containing protein, partial [Chloroflexota bacterium]
MKAALFYGGQDIRVTELPDPTPGPGEVLVRVRAAGICGSDLHGYRAGAAAARREPGTSGHELAGVVVGLGAGVTTPTLGQRVAIEPLHLIGCGACRWCRAGQYEMCPTRGVVAGARRHSSGFAELDVAPVANCVPLPEAISLEEAAILDVYACAVHAAQRVPAGPMDDVAIIGTGPIGLAAAEMYRALGVRRVIVLGRRDAALQKALAFGTDVTVNVATTDPVQAVRDLTGGLGAQVVIEAV